MTFRLTLSISTLIHLLFILTIWFFGATIKPKTFYAPVYSVDLVELPAGSSMFMPNIPAKEAAPSPIKSIPKLTIPKISRLEKIPVIVAKIPEPKISSSMLGTKQPSITAVKPKGTGTTGTAASAGPSMTIGPAGTGLATEGIPFPYPYYLVAIQNKVTENWQPPSNLGAVQQAKTTVFFQIQRNGHISEIRVEQSSGSIQLDEAAIRAVRLADPLPPLPQGFKENTLRVHFGFVYHES